MASTVKHTPVDTSSRLIGLDVFRGWAIVLMVIFHFVYDLAWFGFVSVDVTRDPFWVYFRYVIVSIFMLSVGMSLALVHRDGIGWGRVGRRAMILGAAAVVVTIATRVQSPHAWVYFGILHLIWVVSLVGLLFVHRPWLALGTAALIFAGSWNDGVLWQAQHALFHWARPLLHLPRYTEDIARFFPWFGAALVGMAVYDLGWYRSFFSCALLSSPNRFNRFLAWMGRHALAIYLIHLPLLYGLVWGWKLLVSR